MSHLQYFTYKGFGERVQKDTHYSQAVRIGNIVKISGQCGWDRLTEEIPSDIGQQVDRVFDNVEHTLRQAGGSGWEQVYQIRLYAAPFDMEVTEHFIRNLRKYLPNHQPLLTGVGVAALYGGARLEVEVEAHLGE
ncbi:uncharacterized protein HMPREF1541_05790 [Cyphellophora europaea CBS 101466]|uniref:Translation initiation inhibitor n=1 Tax=Cyphellophora europaea (strain CBS 101466) TaxID=1220924 RepID=W2RV34_CYPE1|nr:uncharacterized protein HMPREF1541_05790 [Cyphellophora europaea CBS 101466]ETN39564.1 hypothetical protein HMPREF1541_05790 [Cyphellophora europaea CBS 101466]